MDDKLPEFLFRNELQCLLDCLITKGFKVIGPKVEDGALVYSPLEQVAELPLGWSDQQAPGRYRINQTDSVRYFHWANGPQALKPLLNPSRNILWQAKRQADGSLEFIVPDDSISPVAVIGVKSCDLSALALQDQHFLEGEYPDPTYQARRKSLFLVAVNCSTAASTCFCASTGDGPEASTGFDIVMTELEDGFILQAGSEAGREVMAMLPLTAVSESMLQQKQKQKETVLAAQSRQLRTIEKTDLAEKRAHPRWDDIAERCLACGNCTMVCPTCFCHHQTEEAQVNGVDSQHVREWDSCFGESHGQLAGFQVRDSVKSRYQQWMIHKLDFWQEQYGRSGCTGCGRCMTWCPAEIDFVAEANLIAGGEQE